MSRTNKKPRTSNSKKEKADVDKGKPSAARPALIFSFALAVVLALGVTSLQAVYRSAPTLEGFGLSSKLARGDRDRSSDESSDFMQTQNSGALMRAQGWVSPGSVETYEARRRWRRGQLAPEIAAIEIIDSAELPMELPLEPPPFSAPPRLIFNTAPSVITGSDSVTAADREPQNYQAQRTKLALPPPLPFDLPAPGQDSDLTTIDSINLERNEIAAAIEVRGINDTVSPALGSVLPSAPAPSNEQQIASAQAALTDAAPSNKNLNLHDLQVQECASAGFLSRLSCEDAVQVRYCADRWNSHPDCRRFDDEVNF